MAQVLSSEKMVTFGAVLALLFNTDAHGRHPSSIRSSTLRTSSYISDSACPPIDSSRWQSTCCTTADKQIYFKIPWCHYPHLWSNFPCSYPSSPPLIHLPMLLSIFLSLDPSSHALIHLPLPWSIFPCSYPSSHPLIHLPMLLPIFPSFDPSRHNLVLPDLWRWLY